jgi:hypothetical protein
LWSEASALRGQTWIGFRFIDIAAADESVLSDWLMHAKDLED